MGHIRDKDHEVLKDYLYQVCLQKGSGEFALNLMFNDILFAEKPILSFIEELKSKTDVSFFYGTWDWMNLKLGDKDHVS